MKTGRNLAGHAAAGLTVMTVYLVYIGNARGFTLLGLAFGSGIAAGAVLCWWAILRDQRPESWNLLRHAWLGGLILGSMGFAAGLEPFPKVHPGFGRLRGRHTSSRRLCV